MTDCCTVSVILLDLEMTMAEENGGTSDGYGRETMEQKMLSVRSSIAWVVYGFLLSPVLVWEGLMSWYQ